MLKTLKFKLIFININVFIYSHGIIITLYINDMLILVKSLKEIK